MSDPAASADPIQTVKVFFETLSRDSVSQLELHYAADAYFKDPFNEVTGLAAIERIFTHMFTQVDDPRFVVTTTIGDAEQAFVCWEFVFRLKSGGRNRRQTIRGASHLKFDDNGRVRYHRDYWDAAEELYEKLPVLRNLMRWLKRRAAA